MLYQVGAHTKLGPTRPTDSAIERELGGKKLPGTYPELVQDYVQQIQPLGPGALDEDDFLRATRKVALACVKDELASKPISKEALRAYLEEGGKSHFFDQEQPANEVRSALVLEQLEECGLLEKHEPAPVPHLRFSFDPIAEYLAAMDVFSLDKDSSELWRQRIAAAANGLTQALARVDEAFGSHQTAPN